MTHSYLYDVVIASSFLAVGFSFLMIASLLYLKGKPSRKTDPSDETNRRRVMGLLVKCGTGILGEPKPKRTHPVKEDPSQT